MADLDWFRSRMRSPGFREVHVAVILFGFAGLFGKFLDWSPLIIVFGRTFFAAAALLPVFMSRSRSQKRCRAVFAAQGALLALHWYTFFLSIQISTVAIGLLTFSTFPLFVTFLEPFFFKEPLYLKNAGIAMLVFAGLVLVIPAFDFSHAPTRGALWGTLSGLTFALLGMANRNTVRSVSPMVLTFYQNFFAALFLAPVILLLGGPFPMGRDLLLLLVLGVVCTALAHYLFIAALVHLKARTAGVIAALEPVYGTLMAILLLGEVPGARTVAGGAVIVGATLLAMESHAS